MTTFLHIGIAFLDSPKVEELEPVFNKALNWLRYAPGCWIVKTTSSPRGWLARLRPHLSSGDHIFIVQIELNRRAGSLPKWAWDWIHQHTAAEKVPSESR